MKRNIYRKKVDFALFDITEKSLCVILKSSVVTPTPPVTCNALHYCLSQPTGGVFVAPKAFPCNMVIMVLKNGAS